MKPDADNVDLEAALNNLTAATQQLIQAVKNINGNNSGRKPKSIPVINIYDALKVSSTVVEAASRIGVSKAYIYKYVPNPKSYLLQRKVTA